MCRPICAAVVLCAALANRSAGQEPADKADAEKPAVTVKRRHELSDEDLRKQLLLVPEVGLNQPTASKLYEAVKAAQKAAEKGLDGLPPDAGGRFYAQLVTAVKRPDMFEMPWRTGGDCQIGKESAERLHVLSTSLRTLLRASVPEGDVRPDPEKLSAGLTAGGTKGGARPGEWTKPEALPTLLQMLQAENRQTRLVLIDVLSGIKGKDASAALAQRALFDLAPEVREKAVQALATRPAAEYQPTFVAGLRWPWTPVADHAAEAIVALDLKEAAGDLLQVLKEQDPRLPYPAAGGALYVREVVRVNHMCNCLLCHAPSQAKEDLVRGRIPIPGEDPPPLYYAERSGTFVRADITFLRQEFSVVQPVANPGKWPGNQRYDYVLRTRKATAAETKTYKQLTKDKKLPMASTPYTEGALYTLRQLTKMDAGTGYDDWAPVVQRLQKALREDKGQDRDR